MALGNSIKGFLIVAIIVKYTEVLIIINIFHENNINLLFICLW